jgi:anti-sigma28 factor (negative regulator of flagellin synthesis)
MDSQDRQTQMQGDPTESEADMSDLGTLAGSLSDLGSEAKTELLRRQVEEGAYHVPAEEIAAKIIEESSKDS